ncbi:MAG: aminotransferase class IV [Desulfobacterales bacterium]|nr:aminotransferase class IV [Desulfobacterales bacterium]
MIVYFNDQYMEKDAVRLSPDDRAFLFGDGLYEVIRSYKGRLFLGREHIERLNYGARHLELNTTEFDFLEEVGLELVKQNKLEDSDATIYFQVTRGAALRSHPFPDPATPLTIYATAQAFDDTAARKKQDQGIGVITLGDNRWARCDMKTTSLTANVLANQRAKEKGCAEAIFIRDGVMLEGTHSNFMAVMDNTLVTAPLSNYILGGITRNHVLKLAADLGIRFEERPVYERDAHMATEMMVTGTTTEVTPIVTVNGNPVGDGKPGPIARKLQAALSSDIQSLD